MCWITYELPTFLFDNLIARSSDVTTLVTLPPPCTPPGSFVPLDFARVTLSVCRLYLHSQTSAAPPQSQYLHHTYRNASSSVFLSDSYVTPCLHHVHSLLPPPS